MVVRRGGPVGPKKILPGRVDDAPKVEIRPTSDTPSLSAHVKSSAPVGGGTAQSSPLGVRLGGGAIKRLWNKTQALLGVGDPGALRRASEAVAEARVLEKSLGGKSDGELRGKLDEVKSQISDATRPLREQLSAKRRALAKAPDLQQAQLLDLEIGKLTLEVDAAEMKAQDAHLGPVFALVSEVAHRQVKMRPYDEQLQAGVLLERGKVVEQYTGEGKTLSAVAPAVLSSLGGRATHIATSSNYLAQRDAAEMAPVYNALGLSVSALLPDGTAIRFDPPEPGFPLGARVAPQPAARKAAYRADVVYGTVAQFGFDHLRDLLATSGSDRVQRPLATLILDEVDSLLIDDARTPLIIAGDPQDPMREERALISAAVEKLDLGVEIEFDRSDGWAALSDEGHDKLAAALHLSGNLNDFPEVNRMIDGAVRARALFVKDLDYVVTEGKVELIGKNGEILLGRRLSGGLHQAIEAREGVNIEAETRTVGQITARDYLSLYQRVAGMTGTAETAESLFHEVYGLDVVRVPTHRPLQRKDEATRLFANIEDKAMAVLEDARKEAAKGRPVLIGCADERSVAALSLLFAEQGIAHDCLTSQDDKSEAKTVIERGGAAGNITLTTPLGGRGVHFALGGRGASAEEKSRVVDAGGLMVLGFEHNACERIDNQLRGRAARQGEPGGSRFYASLEDRFFHGGELPKWAQERPPGKEGLSNGSVTALIDERSRLSDSVMHASLKDAQPYDVVIARHRERWSAQHDALLETEPLEAIRDISSTVVSELAAESFAVGGNAPAAELYRRLAAYVSVPELDGAPASWQGKSQVDLVALVVTQLDDAIAKQFDRMGPAGPEVVRGALLRALDDGFAFHLEQLDSLKQGINWRTVAQLDPKVEFNLDANEAWDILMNETRRQGTRMFLAGIEGLSF